jgi:uncharacterized 2Fe-2S/4Fe-4S cluster protein (DUF4445 family)
MPRHPHNGEDEARVDSPSNSPRLVVELQPVGRRVEVPAGTSLLSAAQTVGVELQSICGGAGTCGGCRVRRAEGQLSALSALEREELTREEIADGFRLACQAVAIADVRVDIPPESLTARQRVQVEGREEEIAPDPIVVPIDIEIEPPDAGDLMPGVMRIAGGDLTVPHPVLADLSDRLRAQDGSARLAVRREEGGRRLVAVLPPAAPLIGLAVDIGTTKLALYLVDLESGRTVARIGLINPQVAWGEDVISRIAYAGARPGGASLLQGKLVAALNRAVAELCAETRVLREQIVEAVVVGNTAMHHLFAGLPVRQLGVAPFAPASTDPLNVPARDVGLGLAAGAVVYLPPSIAGYVGADHTAMLLATGVGDTRRTVLAIDIGTNTEISLAVGGRIFCCSCASGPAFEGAHITAGMRAAPGAIERVRIAGGEVFSYPIERAAPLGICGSGILDAVGEMLRAGVLDERGNFRSDRPRVRARGGQSEFLLVEAAAAGHGRDIAVTRGDVNEIQLAKAAIRAGIDVLLEEAGLVPEALEEVAVAGAFGTYLNLESAVRIGLFPDLPLGRFRQVGNAAGIGARQMLISAERRRAGEAIARRVQYVELTSHPAFHARFVGAMRF